MKERVFFKNTKGDRLSGIISDPSENRDKPIILLCHGFASNKDGRTNLHLEKILNQESLSTFRFDFFGHGESEGNIEELTVSEAVDDIQNAVFHLRESGYKKIALYGSSFGGMASLIAASRVKEFFLLALKSPVSNYKDLILRLYKKEEIKEWEENGYLELKGIEGRKIKIKYFFFQDACQNNGYKAAKKVSIPTLIVHGDRDEMVPLYQSLKIASILKNCRLEVINGADHGYSEPEHFEKMVGLISSFIIKNAILVER